MAIQYLRIPITTDITRQEGTSSSTSTFLIARPVPYTAHFKNLWSIFYLETSNILINYWIHILCAFIVIKILILIPDFNWLVFLEKYSIFMGEGSDNPGDTTVAGTNYGHQGNNNPQPDNNSQVPYNSGDKRKHEEFYTNGDNQGSSNGDKRIRLETQNTGNAECGCCVEGVCQCNTTMCSDVTEDDPTGPEGREKDYSRPCCNCGKDHITYHCDNCACAQCTECYEESNNNHPGGPNTEREGEPRSSEED